jgi:hypothetical protein
MTTYPRLTQLETQHRENLSEQRLRAARSQARGQRTKRRRPRFLRRLRIAVSGRA